MKFNPRKTKNRCKTGKIKWHTELDAKMAMANCAQKGSHTHRNGHSPREIRVYKCPLCHYWHTTSQPKRNPTTESESRSA